MKNLKSLAKAYQGKCIEDCGGVVSKDFQSFCRKAKTAIANECIDRGMTLVFFNPGHYDISGFIKKDDKFAYFSYNVPRGEQAMDMRDEGAMYGWLYRTAKHVKDWSGGINNFTQTAKLIEKVSELLG